MRGLTVTSGLRSSGVKKSPLPLRPSGQQRGTAGAVHANFSCAVPLGRRPYFCPDFEAGLLVEAGTFFACGVLLVAGVFLTAVVAFVAVVFFVAVTVFVAPVAVELRRTDADVLGTEDLCITAFLAMCGFLVVDAAVPANAGASATARKATIRIAAIAFRTELTSFQSAC